MAPDATAAITPVVRQLQAPGPAPARVSLEKWSGTEVKTNGDAQAVYDDIESELGAGTFAPRGRGVVVSKDAPMTFAQLAKLTRSGTSLAKG